MITKFRRLRRLRLTDSLRQLRKENVLVASNCIMPVFINEDLSNPKEVSSMPGVYQHSFSSVVNECKEIERLGISAIILFGIPNKKDEVATSAYDQDGVVQRSIKMIKESGVKIPIIADTCQCEYTSNGHCGPLDSDGYVHNDETLKWLAKTAVSQAKAGADIIAPSTMVDGMIGTIRNALDENGYENTPIVSYGVKYASNFYGPFRDAAGSSGEFCGNRKNHQMDYANRKEAILEMEADIEEGADVIMVKPAMTYLDIISDAEKTNLPVWAYNVSGEYSMVKASAKLGLCDEKSMVEEVLTSMFRAGADKVITYHAKDIAEY